MLEWINENPVFFAAICSVLGAVVGAIITSKTSLKIERGKRLDKILERLEHENKELADEIILYKEQLETFTSIEEKEKSIDKSLGNVYVESFSNGKKREICGFCWETSKQTIPINTDPYYDEYDRFYGRYYDRCGVCQNVCSYIDEDWGSSF